MKKSTDYSHIPLDKPLTHKQLVIIKAVAAGKTKSEAGMLAGASNKNSGHNYASEVLQRPNVQVALERELKRQGITIEAAVRPIADGLRADKSNMQGEIIPDHPSRLKAASMALPLLGINAGGMQVNINFNAHAREQKQRYGL